MITVSPDPGHPRGGHAVLTLAGDAIASDTTEVAVFDNYAERYLGEEGWQPARVFFGPYAVVHKDGKAQITIGPEIVNQIEEYANVRLEVGGVTQDVAWPDDVVPAPGAARIGGIMAAKPRAETPASNLVVTLQDDVAADPAPEPDVAPPAAAAAEQAVSRGKGPAWVIFLALMVLAAGLMYWLFFTQMTETEDADAAPVAMEPGNPCSTAAFRAIESFSGQIEAVRSCGADTTADDALGVLERGAAADDPQALALFGTIYDGAAEDAQIENTIGLSFGDVPATAAEYYARAVAAGSENAGERLAELCARMSGMTDTLTQGAVADYCVQ